MFKTLYNVNEYKWNSFECIGDRFIPLRSCNGFLHSEYNLKHTRKISRGSDSEKQQLYKDILLDVCQVNEDAHILNFSKYGYKKNEIINTKELQYQWPVLPRKKKWCCDTIPFEIYDLPIYNSYGGFPLEGKINPVDWSTTGFLASTSNGFLWLKNPQTNEQRRFRHPQFCSKYIKWDCSGQLISTIQWNQEALQIINLSVQRMASVECNCRSRHIRSSCKLTALEWRRDNTLLTGCTNGRLCIWKGNQLQHNILLNCGKILEIKFSAYNQNYFVVNSNDSAVHVLHWPPRPLRVIYTHIQAFAWHPFQESLLCVAAKHAIIMQNVASKKYVAEHETSPNSTVDALTWNELSGELVISRTNYRKNRNEITVYANFETIVEKLSYQESHVPCLLWSPDRSILATACLKEEICLWKFFGRNSNRKKVIHNPLSIHNSNFGKSIR